MKKRTTIMFLVFLTLFVSTGCGPAWNDLRRTRPRNQSSSMLQLSGHIVSAILVQWCLEGFLKRMSFSDKLASDQPIRPNCSWNEGGKLVIYSFPWRGRVAGWRNHSGISVFFAQFVGRIEQRETRHNGPTSAATATRQRRRVRRVFMCIFHLVDCTSVDKLSCADL